MILTGDCRELMAALDAESIDAIVTDPPYELNFMGRGWDSSGVAYDVGTWTAALRVLKPGGHLLAFGGTRTYHRMACAIEDAGFEIRDSIHWIYGSGFPKSLDVSKAIDKAAGAEREVVGDKLDRPGYHLHGHDGGEAFGHGLSSSTPETRAAAAAITAPATPDAERWQGWGTALKPAHEPVVVARKPLIGTVAANVLAHGTGALNVDGCRVGTVGGTADRATGEGTRTNEVYGTYGACLTESLDAGRWPPNVLLGPDAAAEMDRQSGSGRDGVAVRHNVGKSGGNFPFGAANKDMREDVTYGGGGGASRFFPIFRYEAKADSSERPRADGIAHPTVKPVDLMRWLVRLVTPPGGIVLDPFGGTGTTAEACIVEGFGYVVMEQNPEYVALIEKRLSKDIQPVMFQALER